MTVETSTWATKKGLAQMLKGGVIMDVVTPDQAKIAEDAGAVAVMALERVPADIRKAGGVARMSDPSMIVGIMDAVSIPVMAKARIGHFVEAQVLEALGVDYIDESEVLTPADERNHIDKHAFKVPFVCGCRNLGEALRRINEGAAMMRTKGEAGTGNIVEAVRQLRDVLAEMRRLQAMRDDELFVAAKELGAPYELVKDVAANGKLPVVNFVAGGISTPCRRGARDAARCRGRLRRFGHLQERGPGPDGQRHRAGDHVLRRPEEDRRGLQGPRSADARDRPRGDPRPGAPRRQGLVGRPARPRMRTESDRRWPRASPRRSEAAMKIGVLALQGAFREHLDTLHAIGVDGVRVREPADLDGVSGLILPGGESTTMRQLIERWGLHEPILDLADRGAPIFGTCAGMIVLAAEIAGGEPPILPLLDVTVERNAFGRQLDSFESELDVPILGGTPVHAVFIRAPIIERTGPDVDVLARLDDGRIVAVRQRNILATAFHPELAGETRFHRLMATMAAEHDDPGEGSGRRPHPTRRSLAARHDRAHE